MTQKQETVNNPLIHNKYRTGEKSLTPQQVETLLDNIPDLHDYGIIQLAVSTGMRREDIVNVKSKDIDVINCSVTYYERKKKRTRTVFVSKNVMNTLQKIMKINKRATYLFPGRMISKGGHISSKTAYNIFNRYLKAVGLEPRPFHALRATCYKMCQKKGWNPEQAARHLGDTIRVAQEHYAVPSVEEMKEAAIEKAII